MYNEYLKKYPSFTMKIMNLIKNLGQGLIVIPEEPNVYLSDHEYFCIHDIIFDRIKSTHKDKNISLNIISKEPNENHSYCDATDIRDDNICKKKKTLSK